MNYLTKTKEELLNVVEEQRQEIESLKALLNKQASQNPIDKKSEIGENNDPLKIITESSLDAIILMDNSGSITFWNPAAETILGYSNAEAIGINLHKLLAPEKYHQDYDRAFEIFKQSGEGPVINKILELKAIRKDGTEIFIELSISRIKIDNKWNALGFIRDISQRKLAEISLRRSERKFQSLIENINDVVYEVDVKGNINFISSPIERIIGYKPEEIIGKNFLDFVGKNAEYLSKRFQMLNENPEINNDYNVKSKSGEDRWIRLSTKAIFRNGTLAGGRGTLVDITATKLAELELKKSEALYSSIMNASPDTITITDLEGNILLASPSAMKMFEIDDPEVIKNRKLLDFLDEKSHARAYEAIHEMQQGIFSGAEEYIGRKADGTLFDIEVNGDFIRDENGQPINMVFVTRDISDRKKAEQELQSSQNTFRRLVENINDVVFEITLDGTIKYVSPSAERIMKLSMESLLGHNFMEFVYPDDREIVYNTFYNKAYEVSPSSEYRYTTNDGKIYWVQISAQNLYDENKQVIGRSGILHDITERKLAEEKLRRSEESFRHMVENINDVVYEVGMDGIVKYVSPSIERFLGYKPEELIGKNFFDYMYEDDRMAIIERLKTLNERDYSFLEYRYYSKNKEIKWVRSSTNPFFEKGEMVGGRGVLIDITEQKKAEEKLQQSEAQFRMVFENVFDGISIFEENIDPSKRRLVDCNEQYAAMAGRSREELLKIGYTYELTQTIEENANQMRLLGLDKQTAFHGSFKWLRPDGRENSIEYIARPITWQGKQYSIGIDRDITEYKRKEEQLQKLSQAIEQSPVSIVITNLDGDIEYANPKACETTGYSINELKGQNPRVLKSGETPSDEYQYLWESISHGSIWKGIFHNKRKNGELYWESSQISPIINEQGNIISYLAIKEDITERKRVQEELAKSEKRFRQVAEQTLTVIWEVDEKGMYTYVSPVARIVWGYEPNELVNQKYFYDLHPKEGRNEFKRAAMEVFRNHGIFNDLINPIVTKNKTTIWVSTNGEPILDEHKKLIGYRGSDNDITAKKLAKDALIASENELNYAQEIAKMGSWILDLKNNKMAWSMNHYHILGLKPYESEIPDDYFSKLIHPDDVQSFDQTLERIHLSGKEASTDLRIVLPNGITKWIQTNIVPIFENGILIKLQGVNIDITEKKKNEESIKYQKERLNAILKAIPDLIFIVDKNGVYLEFFASNSDKLLIKPEQIIGSNIKDAFDEKQAKFFIVKINEAITKKKTLTFDYSINLQNSESENFEARIVPFDRDKVLILSRDITEKTKKEAEIKRLSLAVEQSPVSVVITDLEANIEYVNPSFEQTTGYTIQEVIGKNANILKSGETLPSIYQNMWETIESGQKWNGEWLNKKKNGDLFWEFVSITPIHDSEGNIINYLAIKQDITQRKQAEQEIRELNSNLEIKIEERTLALAASEKSYRRVVENVAEVIFQTDIDGNWLFLNNSWESITGFSVKESIGQMFINYVYPDDRDRNMKEFEPLIKRQKDYCRHEIRYLTKDGGFRWIEVYAKLGLNKNDEAIGTYGTLQDITERRLAEQTVNLQKERLESIIDGSSLGTWEWNVQTGETIFNERWADLIGYTLEELTPIDINTWIKFVHPDDLVRSEQLLNAHFNGETDYYVCEARMRHKDGNWIWVLDSGKVISWTEDGKPLWMFGSHHDITERKRAEVFEKEMLHLSPKLTGIPLTEINSAINLALSRIGKVLEADRSYIFEFTPDLQSVDNTFEWCNDQITPQIDQLKTLPTSTFPRIFEKLVKLDHVIIDSVADLPESWQVEKEILEPQGIQSLIMIPMVTDNNLIGFVGLDSVNEKRTYTSAEINILKIWGSMLSSLINNQRAERLLEQTRQNYETFFNTIDDFLWVLDQQGNIIHTNNTVRKRLEYKEEELIDKNVLMVHPANRRDEAGRIVGEMLAGISEFCPVPVVTKSGRHIPVETKVKPGYWDGKQVIFGVSKDISKIKLSEEKFSAAFQSSSAMMAISDFENGKFIDVNQAFIDATGYQKDELIGKTIAEFGILSDSSLRDNVIVQIKNGESVKEIETIYITKNNERRTGLLSTNSIFIGDQHCLLTVTVDITARKRAEEQLQWNKSLLEMMSNSSPLGFLVVDNRTDEILYFNKRFCQIWGIEQLEEQMLRGELRNNDIIPHCLPVLVDIPKFAESCKPLQDENNRIVVSDEIQFTNNRTIHRYSTQIRGIDDKYFGRFYIFEDITEEKKAQEELRNARNEAEKANIAKSEFLSRMSHELRTPMNSILGFAQLLEMGDLSVGQRKGVTHIMKSGKHLLDLINEVLDISRIESGRLSLSLEPVQLSSLIMEMTDVIKLHAAERQIQVHLNDSPTNQLFVQSDRQRLKQVILNLLNNAIKYNKISGSIFINVEQKEHEIIRLSIKDTGLGIAEEFIPKLFTPFERIGADKTSTEGTGLGLSVVKKLMEAMGGSYGVESTLGLGSTFWIELPQCESQFEKASKSGNLEQSSTEIEGRSGTVLYIEDNRSNIELVEQILSSQRADIKLVTEIHGKKALSLAINHKPNLILLDLNLPDIHGSQVLEQLQSVVETKDIPVVIISADAMPQQLRKLLDAGAKNYLTKPLDIPDFLRLIHQYLPK